MTADDGSPNGTRARAGSPQVVHVRVQAAGSRALSEATVTVLDEQGRQVTAGRVGPDGSFRTPVPDTGAYLVIGAAPGCAPQTAAVVVDGVTPPTPVDVVFTGATPGSVSGVVTGTDRRPVPGATVFVGDEQGEVLATCHTPPNGAYTIGDLPAGTYTLVAGATGFRPASDLVVITERSAGGTSIGTGPEPARRDLVLVPEVALQGTARTVDGRPIPDARVALLGPDGLTVAVTDTDAAGDYAFSEVPDGDYTLIATGFPPVADIVRLGDGSARHDVRLAHPDPGPDPARS
ncbi:MAG: carboxypeptidase-like regulatory domain-containing protein [Pseudonocardia sp.]|nr:carboxypeptidase-like regulatory domain-containing protein [Pseudonocardia sp.]